MATSSDMNAICSQLLTPKDLEISDELFNKVQEDKIVTQIVDSDTVKSIKIYSTYQLFLSSITPILHDIGFMIIDEVTYNIQNGTKMIFVSRFNLRIADDSDIKRIDYAKENLENIITSSLLDSSLVHSKVFSLVYNQNFNLRKISLVRAFIEYIDQSVLTINSATILNTLTTHHHISDLFVDYFCVKFNPKQQKKKRKIRSSRK